MKFAREDLVIGACDRAGGTSLPENVSPTPPAHPIEYRTLSPCDPTMANHRKAIEHHAAALARMVEAA